jgi:hypothetical protein
LWNGLQVVQGKAQAALTGSAFNDSVLFWAWQSVCSSYCRQLNAVSFSTHSMLHCTDPYTVHSMLSISAHTSCCTVPIQDRKSVV